MKLYAYNLNCKYPEKSGNTLNTILLVLEFCPGGELFDILYYTQHLKAKTARTYFLQMIHGIKACHNNGIVHRDIKPQNLLMDANYQLKITDFGLSFLCKDESSADGASMKTSYVGTRGYQAPELLKREKYTKACDLFSSGVVLFILLTGYPPFEQASKQDKWYRPLAAKGGPDNKTFWKQHEGCGVDPACQDLISGLLAYRPKDRLSIDQVLKHKWCSGKEAPVHSPSELAKVLKERHKETRRRRRKDKKKTSEMQNSVKKKKKRDLPAYMFKKTIDGKVANKADTFTLGALCPVVEKAKCPQTLMTFFTGESDLFEAYELAFSVFNHAFGDKAFTEASKKKPWEITTTIKTIAPSDTVYTVQGIVVKVKDTGKFAFSFKRLAGPPLGFKKIWQTVESYLLVESLTGKFLFHDDVDEKADVDDAEKSEEAPAKKAEEPAVDEEVKSAEE